MGVTAPSGLSPFAGLRHDGAFDMKVYAYYRHALTLLDAKNQVCVMMRCTVSYALFECLMR